MTDVVADPATIGPDLSQGVDRSAIPEDGVFPGHVDGEAVMLALTRAGIVAMTATCSHYSGPLYAGLRVGDTIQCPWHHACFDLRTGRAAKAPALAPVACWRVEEVGGKVFVREKLDTPSPSCPKSRSSRRMVIVGGGAAGFAAAQRLRTRGFDGEIVVLSADADAPYDRPNVSKDYLAGTAEPEWMPLKDDAFYADLGIDVRLNTSVTAIDAKAHTVILGSGDSLAYDKLLIATGAEPIRPSSPGFEGPHVHTLRTIKDADAVLGDIDASQTVAVIGSSFIGMEVAASLRNRGVAVHVIGPEPAPLATKLGPQIGSLIRLLHEANGVVFHLERRAVGYEDGLVKLDDGTVVAASRVVLGIGVKPRLHLAEQAGLKLDRGVLVDASMRTSDPGIFAAGDIARFPGAAGDPVRIEHWVVAERQGQVAAAAMMGEEDTYSDAPFFWSVHYDVTIRYVGHAEGWDAIEEIGSVAAKDAEVRYIKDGKVVAVATINRDLDALKAGERVPYPR
ncbi:FAD-dependent oxidoreductase [Luteibacter yeojuensis]|uniref:FAD-dependent oxidoreductase n=1 Tax=Luteibacter yeojuensis TaxID=345309 RepID=A0A7X5QXI6_9GAMM|nr:FAD-dependent oxidoreductase [Luteibacter yeojuensis]NID17229.1 FAD-dependent oxidoreductase [Luteibacter yeojuensis]